MAKGRKPSRRDLPGTLLVFVTIFLVFAIGMIFGPSEVVSRELLTSVSGRVTSVGRWQRRANEQLRIDIAASDRVHHLTNDFDLVRLEPKLASVSLGDEVVALVEPDKFWRDLDWFYEVRRGDTVLLDYGEASAYLLRREAWQRHFARYVGLAGVLLLLVALILRVRYGAWSAT